KAPQSSCSRGSGGGMLRQSRPGLRSAILRASSFCRLEDRFEGLDRCEHVLRHLVELISRERLKCESTLCCNGEKIFIGNCFLKCGNQYLEFVRREPRRCEHACHLVEFDFRKSDFRERGHIRQGTVTLRAGNGENPQLVLFLQRKKTIN